MRASVLAIFPSFTASLEGSTLYPYLDIKGIVTTAEGCAFFAENTFAFAGWTINGTRPATTYEIQVGWDALQSDAASQANRPLSQKRLAASYATMTSLRLTQGAFDTLVRQRLEEMEAVIAARFPNWSGAPADAQLATLATAWAEGAYGLTHSWPKFDAAFLASDWETCSRECHLDETGNHGLIARNARNALLFHAAAVLGDGDPDAIHGWPAASSV